VPDGKPSRRSARARLLAAAAECFYANGVQATGIDTITTAAGVAKMSLYNNFRSKDDLVNAYLEARHEEWLGFYAQRLQAAENACERVLAVFDAYLDHSRDSYRHGFRGCGLLNAAAELPSDAPGRQIVRRHKEDVQALLATHLEDAGIAEDRCGALAEHLALLLEGAVARAGLEGNDRLQVAARECARQLLSDALKLTSDDKHPA
jgi:AcrR family transcriptional regulator